LQLYKLTIEKVPPRFTQQVSPQTGECKICVLYLAQHVLTEPRDDGFTTFGQSQRCCSLESYSIYERSSKRG